MQIRREKKMVETGQNYGALYCCSRQNFAIKGMLWNTQYFYIANSDKQLNDTHRTGILEFSLQKL